MTHSIVEEIAHSFRDRKTHLADGLNIEIREREALKMTVFWLEQI